ncbi:MrcB family domain-containing protein [Streptomyces sp. NPDC088923]|uniref:MrcB family domain-containing protein n=1 Tax=Streptomyces sp. NPDC088923 TaxID=3365913 RepID=UPI00381E77E0
MMMRNLLREIARTYDRRKGTGRDVEGQKILRGVGSLDLPLPPGFRAEGHGGQTSAAATPWIGVFDDGVNSDPKSGLYIAYIFSADLWDVYLTIQQGSEHLNAEFGRGKQKRRELRRNGRRIRAYLGETPSSGWSVGMPLRDPAERPRAYEAANVFARRYATQDLPDERFLQEDLIEAALMFYQAAGEDSLAEKISSLNQLLSEKRAGAEASLREWEPASFLEEDPLAHFHPKDDTAYHVKLAESSQLRNRYHEALVASFGRYVLKRGFIPVTDGVHPRDIVLKKAGLLYSGAPEVLVEAKFVKDGKAMPAVREAVAQLLEYRYFLYRAEGSDEPYLLALFSENVGEAFEPYIEDLGFGAVWADGRGGWAGNTLAREWGIV